MRRITAALVAFAFPLLLAGSPSGTSARQPEAVPIDNDDTFRVA